MAHAAELPGSGDAEGAALSCPLFAFLPEPRRAEIAREFRALQVPAGTFLCQRGLPSPGLFLVLRGTAVSTPLHPDWGSAAPPTQRAVQAPYRPLERPLGPFHERLRNNSGLTNGAHDQQAEPEVAVRIGTGKQEGKEPERRAEGATDMSQGRSNAKGSLRSAEGAQGKREALQFSLDDDLGSASAVAGEGAAALGPEDSNGESKGPGEDSRLAAPVPAERDNSLQTEGDTSKGAKLTDGIPGLTYPLRLGQKDWPASALEFSSSQHYTSASAMLATKTSRAQPCIPSGFPFKAGAWFGHPPSGFPAPLCPVSVIAQTDMVCAFLPQNPDAPTSRSDPRSMESFTRVVEGPTRVPRPLTAPRIVPTPADLNELLVGKLEEILHLQDLQGEADTFNGITPKEMFDYPRIFGGQLLGQGLMAATRTVDPTLIAHSLHAYFLRPGNTSAPVVYHVERIRDGAAFAVRRVKAFQAQREIFLLTASFQKREPGLSYRAKLPGNIPPPEALTMVEEEEWRLRTTPALPMAMRRRLVKSPVRPMPVEIRHCESVESLAVAQLLRDLHTLRMKNSANPGKLPGNSGDSDQGATQEGQVPGNCPREGSKSSGEEGNLPGRSAKEGSHLALATESIAPPPLTLPPCKPELNVWLKARGLSDAATDLRLHRCIIAYFSDFVLLGTALAPHGAFPANPRKFNMASLDHAMWFHEDCRADEWLLYALSSPWSGNARGMSFGRMFTHDGVLAVSTAQEGLIRPIVPKPRL